MRIPTFDLIVSAIDEVTAGDAYEVVVLCAGGTQFQGAWHKRGDAYVQIDQTDDGGTITPVYVDIDAIVAIQLGDINVGVQKAASLA